MGWTTMPLASMGGHTSAKAYLDAQFTYERTAHDGSTRGLRVIASSCLRNKVYYAAVQPITNGVAESIFAVVCLVRWNPRDKEGYVFGYKDMTENMGPCEVECPERILALLGPTNSEYALDWRRRCHANLAKRARSIEDGARVKLPTPIKFTDGHAGDEFIVEKRGRRLTFLDPDTRRRYRISGFLQLSWTVVRETKVHKTIFA